MADRCHVCNDSGHTCSTCGAPGDGCPACDNHVPASKTTSVGDHAVRVRIMAQEPRLFLVDKLSPDGGLDPGLLALTEAELDDALEALFTAKQQIKNPKCVYVVSHEKRVMVDRG